MHSSLPQARRSQTIVQAMDNELVVYDTMNAQANVLNHTAAVIWKLCDGKTNISEIAAGASRELNAPVDATLVWYTLDQLSKKNLMETRATLPANLKGMTRRDFLRAGAVGAAVMLPVIVSMTAPKVSHAASCVAGGQPCDSLTNCCSGGVGACSDGTCP